MQRPNLTRPFWIALSTLLLFIAGLFTSVILVEECHTEQECDFEDPDTVQCPEGLECCENGICCQIADPELIDASLPDTPPPPRACDVGETITDACTCRAPNQARNNICTGPDPIPLACQDPLVQDTLKRLDAACKENGGIEFCPPEKISAFVIDNKDSLLELARSQAPHSASILFETATPAPGKGWRWPGRAREAEILAWLEQRLDLRQSSGFMLMMIVNSDIGTDKVNIPIARERTNVGLRLLAALNKPGFKPLQGIVTSNVKISPSEFRAAWGADPGNQFPERFIGPSKSFEQKLQDQLKRHGNETRWLKHTINQAVVLIPIACDIHSLPPNAAPV